MNDNELLHLAAKAARIELRIYEGLVVERGSDCVSVTGNGLKWNPLTDDGDALRLAVRLNMQIVITGKSDSLSLGVTDAKSTESGWHQASHIRNDPFDATRLAIVRAAAAIGKEMAS